MKNINYFLDIYLSNRSKTIPLSPQIKVVLILGLFFCKKFITLDWRGIIKEEKNKYMEFEKFNRIEAERELNTEVVGSSCAPEKLKENPFYNNYHWGMADWVENKLYLPDGSDEAISFSVASHELGHLVKKGRIEPDRNNFEATYQEEVRAWREGWKYLEKHLVDYYDNQKYIVELKTIKDLIEDKFLNITLLTEPFYQKSEANNIKEQREVFLQTEKGQQIKTEIDGLKEFVENTLSSLNKETLLKKINWDKYLNVVKKCLVDIEKDNANC